MFFNVFFHENMIISFVNDAENIWILSVRVRLFIHLNDMFWMGCMWMIYQTLHSIRLSVKCMIYGNSSILSTDFFSVIKGFINTNQSIPPIDSCAFIHYARILYPHRGWNRSLWEALFYIQILCYNELCINQRIIVWLAYNRYFHLEMNADITLILLNGKLFHSLRAFEYYCVGKSLATIWHFLCVTLMYVITIG